MKADDEVVPWLAATGELAYSPNPRLNVTTSSSIHGSFPHLARGRQQEAPLRVRRTGEGQPDSAAAVSILERRAARRTRSAVRSNGLTDSAGDVNAPIAAYRHEGRLLLMQHGRYHIGGMDGQPRIEQGEAVIVRGIQSAPEFLVYRLSTAAMRRRVMDVHARSMTDSVVSFNAAHCNLMRTETGYLNDETFVFDRHCVEVGLDSTAPTIRSTIYSGYALEEW